MTSFETTRWSLIARSTAADMEVRRVALNSLLTRYLPALQAFLVIQKRVDPDRAEDLLQNFVTDKILMAGLLDQASRQRGRFRTLLLTSLERFCIDQFRKEQADKRGGRWSQVTHEVADPALHPDIFEIAWSKLVLDRAIQQMARTCRGEKLPIWQVFDGRILSPLLRATPPTSYDRLLSQTGLESFKRVANCLITAKRRFRKIVHQVIGEFVEEDDIPQELSDMIRTLGHEHLGVGESQLQAVFGADELPSFTTRISNPQLLLDLLAGENLDEDWSAGELSALFAHILATPLTKQGLRERLGSNASLFELLDSGATTLSELLLAESTSPAALRRFRRWSRRRMLSESSALRSIGVALFFTATAATIVRFGVNSVRLSPAAMREGFSRLLSDGWIAGSIADLVRAALRLVSPDDADA